MRNKVKETINFNKEILIGEIGALAGTQGFGHFASKIFSSSAVISAFVVLGAIIGASLFWFLARLYHRKIQRKETNKTVAKEISYFAPASAFLAIFVYYPTLFFVTKYFLKHHDAVSHSAIISQVIAFVMFLIGINVYRYILIKLKKIVL